MSCCDIFFNETLFITINESTEAQNVSCATGIQTALHGRLSGIHRHLSVVTKPIKYNFDPILSLFITAVCVN
jgi:hypothetical protein